MTPAACDANNAHTKRTVTVLIVSQEINCRRQKATFSIHPSIYALSRCRFPEISWILWLQHCCIFIKNRLRYHHHQNKIGKTSITAERNIASCGNWKRV